MPEHRTRGLVLRTFDQGESDRLLHLYTAGLGRVSAIAKGARRSRRRFPGTLEIFSLLDVQLVDPPRASLMRLDGASLVRGFPGLVADLGRYAIACQLLEILDRFTGEGEASPELFDFAVGVLGVVEAEVPDRLLALLVRTKTLCRMGYRPQLTGCALCGGPPAAFAPRDGGALCSRCAQPEDDRAPAAVLASLEAGIRSPLRERRALGFDAERVRRAEGLMERFFAFHVGLDLRSSECLAAFVRQPLLDADETPGDTAPRDDVPNASGGGGTSLGEASPRP